MSRRVGAANAALLTAMGAAAGFLAWAATAGAGLTAAERSALCAAAGVAVPFAVWRTSRRSLERARREAQARVAELNALAEEQFRACRRGHGAVGRSAAELSSRMRDGGHR